MKRRAWLLFFVILQIFVIWGIYESIRGFKFTTNVDLFRGFNKGYISFNNPDYREPFNASFQGASKIRMLDFFGDLEIEYSDVNEITFIGEKILSAKNKDMDAFNAAFIEEQRSGNEVVLRWVRPKMYNGEVGFNGKVLIPNKTSSLKVDVSFGKVTSNFSIGELDISANLGEVIVNKHKGPLTVSADLGAVKLNEILAEEKLRINADLGDIKYRGTLAADSEFHASLGSIRLTLPENTVTNIDARVDLGSLTCDFPLTSTQRDGLGKKVNGVLGFGMEEPYSLGKLIIRANLGSVDISKEMSF